MPPIPCPCLLKVEYGALSGWSHGMEEQKCSEQPPAVLSSSQQCPSPNSALLICICRLIKPKPFHIMFPKHSLITINQQACGATAYPVSILLMRGEACQMASLAPEAEIWVLPRLRRQRHHCEVSGTGWRSLHLDNKK